MLYNQPFDQPALPNAPFVNGNPGTGVAGSIPPAAQMEYPQREIVNALEVAGLTPSNGDLTQLAQAMSIGLWLGAMSGSANALTDTLPTLATTSDGSTQYLIPALVVGMTFHGIIPATNTGPATLTLTGFGTAPGAKPIVRKDNTPLQAGDLPSGATVSWRWDGTSFRVVGMVASDIAAPAVAAVNAGRKRISLTGSGTFTVPAGVTQLFVTVRGAGAGGGGVLASPNAIVLAPGGSGGSFATGAITVTPGQQISYTQGLGGTAGTAAGAAGGNGGTTTFGSYLTASGGNGGTAGYNGNQNPSPPAPPSAGTGGSINSAGGPATNGAYIGTTGGQGGTGGGSYGQGACNLPAIGFGQGIGGLFPGIGGNGAATAQNGNSFNGGAGANGEIIVEY